MDIGEIVSDSIKYPSSDWKKVLMFGLLCLASIFIITIPFAVGYLFRSLKASIAGVDELPEFDEWGEMYIDGLKFIVVSFGYALVPILIYLLVIGAIFMLGNSAAAIWLLIIGMLIYFVVAIIAALFETIALAHMAYNDSELGSAFRFSEIRDIISQIGWIDYIIWFIVVGIIGTIIGFVGWILFFTVIGIPIAILIVAPYASLFFYRALALLYAYD